MRVAAVTGVLVLMLTGFAAPVAAADGPGLFNVAGRAKQLALPEFAKLRNACLAIAADPKWADLKPISGLKATEGYGTDKAAEDFAWAIMVLGGRALAGDQRADADATALLARFAAGKAFAATEAEH